MSLHISSHILARCLLALPDLLVTFDGLGRHVAFAVPPCIGSLSDGLPDTVPLPTIVLELEDDSHPIFP